MDLYEYQGKKLFREYGIKVPNGIIISDIGTNEFPEDGVVKVQVLTGGRGKAGGVKVCNTKAEVEDAVNTLLGADIKGHKVNTLLIEEKASIKREFYFSIFINRKNKVPSMMFSASGGMDIESVDKSQISIVDVNPLLGIHDYMIKDLLDRFDIDAKNEISDVIKKAWKLFADKKLQLLEINPLIETESGEITALDSKVTMDDWAIDPDIDVNKQEGGSQTEFERSLIKYGMNAVEMDGDVLVWSAGAGIAMATADCIKAKGISLRGVVDEGSFGSAPPDEEAQREAAKVQQTALTLKPKVILLNMHFQAGKTDQEAHTIRFAFDEAVKNGQVKVIARFKGRNCEKAMEVMKGSPIKATMSFQEAIDWTVEAAKE